MAEMLLGQLKSSRSTNGLEEAVKQCIAAASNENDPSIQKILLRVEKKRFYLLKIISYLFNLSLHYLVDHFYVLI